MINELFIFVTFDGYAPNIGRKELKWEGDKGEL